MSFNHPYDAGFDSVISGPNTDNCFFGWFAHRSNTQWWEQGVRDAKALAKKHGIRWLRMLLATPSYCAADKEPPFEASQLDITQKEERTNE